MPAPPPRGPVLPRLADNLRDLLRQRDQLAEQVEGMLDAHVAEVLTPMPGIGVRTAARILLEAGNGSAFPTSGNLAAYAGQAPVTRRFGTSICVNTRPSVATSSSDPPSRCLRSSPWQIRQAAPSTTNAPNTRSAIPPLICLASHWIDVRHAMLRTRIQ